MGGGGGDDDGGVAVGSLVLCHQGGHGTVRRWWRDVRIEREKERASEEKAKRNY